MEKQIILVIDDMTDNLQLFGRLLMSLDVDISFDFLSFQKSARGCLKIA